MRSSGLRSIPAHAGEPKSSCRSDTSIRVYPRPRGGTETINDFLTSRLGLSPPTRGNPDAVSCKTIGDRSIPAHAGEPSRGELRLRFLSVYPRPRGGTAIVRLLSDCRPGLSPPTRGNPVVTPPGASARGSIPAHAGEPPSTGRRSKMTEVYPRPRGGTAERAPYMKAGAGLSPPTRGNRAHLELIVLRRRSIPAHAGEPTLESAGAPTEEVYPRPRGGTRARALVRTSGDGLSPPTRGNQSMWQIDSGRRRSIPAHAGEPVPDADGICPVAVYPRPRGGTAAPLARIANL